MAHLAKSLSRREMLKMMGLSAGAVALASCAPPAPPPAAEAPAQEAPAEEAPAAEAPAAEAPPTPTPGAMMATGAIAADYEAGQAAYGWYDEWHPSGAGRPAPLGTDRPGRGPVHRLP